MKNYSSDKIRNIALLGHSSTGKTSLAEAMMFEAGIIQRLGSVEEGNTLSDYNELEIQRGSSVFSSVMHTEWKDYKINIIDTPGSQDFIGEMVSALRVVETGVLLFSASEGIGVSSELIWQYTEKFKTPMIMAVNKIDHDKSNFDKTVEDAKERFGRAVAVVQYPVNEGTGFNAFIDVLNMVMYEFNGNNKPSKSSIPASELEKANKLHNELIEQIAENDESLMNLYFEKGSLTEDEMCNGLRKSMLKHQLFPLFCISAKKNMGVARLMSYIDNVAPSLVDMPNQIANDGTEVICDSTKNTVAFVFKIHNEHHVGDLTFFKVYSGSVKSAMELVNPDSGVTEQLNNLFYIDGKKRNDATVIVAGDIGATVKLKNTHPNNTLCDKSKKVILSKIEFPSYKIRTAVAPDNTKDDVKLSQALTKIHEEDPTIIVEHSQELKQVIIYAQGEIQLSIIKLRLENQFGVKAHFIEPKLPYRETIQKQIRTHYRHKKQSGGAGQFADVHLVVEPWHEGMPQLAGVSIRGTETHDLPWGGKLIFQNCIVGGVIDTRFMPAIMKGVMEKMHEGPLVGSYVRDVRVSVVDGGMHPVDSNEAAFRTAGMRAFKEAFVLADPRILEPIYELNITVPNEFIGDVMSDLPARRGIIVGIETDGIYQKITARMPLAEVDKYSTALRSITQGRANYLGEFVEYGQVPHDIQNKLHQVYLAETSHED
ncbi:MAG: elongation factor G [Candidatus Kapabacteria bacterium]|nr:elongation factor G [Candidatus Kapabacteria bacterium]